MFISVPSSFEIFTCFTYFSVSFMNIAKGKGFESIAHVCTFKKMKKLVKNWKEASCALFYLSEKLLVTADGCFVKRRFDPDLC